MSLIRRRRKALGISLKELGAELGISWETVSNVESEVIHPRSRRHPRQFKQSTYDRYMAALDRLKERWQLEEKWQ